MSIDSRGILAEIESFALSSGLFDQVNRHEPKSAPARTGVTAGIWSSGMRAGTSGLDRVSVVLTFQLRIYTSMLQEPQDEIDPRLLDATDAMFAALAGNFTLSGKSRYVDIFGSDSDGLSATPGYLSQDSKIFRVMDIAIPIIVNDAYAEVA